MQGRCHGPGTQDITASENNFPSGNWGSERQRGPGGLRQEGPFGNQGVSYGCYLSLLNSNFVLSFPTSCLKGPMLLFLSSPSPPAPVPPSHQPSETKGMKTFICQGSYRSNMGSEGHSSILPTIHGTVALVLCCLDWLNDAESDSSSCQCVR